MNICWQCHESVDPEEDYCHHCGAFYGAFASVQEQVDEHFKAKYASLWQDLRAMPWYMKPDALFHHAKVYKVFPGLKRYCDWCDNRLVNKFRGEYVD